MPGEKARLPAAGTGELGEFVRAGAVWRVSLKPTDAPVFTAALSDGGTEHRAIYDWSGGLVWLLIGEQDDAGAQAIREQVAALGGHATLIRGSDDLKARIDVFQPEPAPLEAITNGMRAKFDPRGILNPGLMG